MRDTGAQLSVSGVREGRRLLRVSYPDPTTLVIDRPTAAGETVVVSMNWQLVLPSETGQRMKGRGHSVRLASFFPLLVGRQRVGPRSSDRPPQRGVVDDPDG
jgi:hypothetical protein